MLIDTHAHVNFNAYKEDSREVIRRTLDNGVWMINVGSQYTTSQRAVEMAENYSEGVYAAIGLHPVHLETGLVKIKDDPEEIQFKTTEESFDCCRYKELARSKKVVAIGETGFDYYWRPKSKTKQEQFKDKQKKAFLNQLELSQELNLPLIVHCRMAHEELIETLNYELKTKNYKLTGVIHCFTGSLEQAKKYIELGFYIGLNGIIFKMNLDEVIKNIPQDRIVLETDCPYLTPPMAETQRNEPMYVKYVAEKVAKLKGLTFEDISKITTENAKKLFRI
ncbi:MAG: TatD family hydrolase [Candidatus Pacebacteria bacterium]|nr:TatD family hydrolase [Candidatus Paceibacterota bacterium]